MNLFNEKIPSKPATGLGVLSLVTPRRDGAVIIVDISKTENQDLLTVGATLAFPKDVIRNLRSHLGGIFNLPDIFVLFHPRLDLSQCTRYHDAV